MASRRGDKIFPHFWYVSEAEEAARFYASIFPDSRVERVIPIPVDTPSGPAGSVKVVDFTLLGQRFQAMSAGPLDPFNHAISMVVVCDDQAEIDRYWSGLLQGGQEEACGWLKDRYGVSWQIVPRILDEMIADRDLPRASRVANALLKMVKLDLAKLQAAYEGR
jgi:predicted 3-demethylubiquinone-9 3-methyltransferase (glyoxalase superfamily)